MSSPVGIPDMLSNLRMGKSQQAARQALERAQTELATGEKSDRFKATGGDVARLDAMERSIGRIDARQPLIAMAQNRAAATQLALGTAADAVGTLGVDLMNTVETIQSGSLDIVLGEAKIAIEQTISALNTSFGGRYLFSGAATGTPPFKSVEDITDGLKTAVSDAAAAKGAPGPALPLNQAETTSTIKAFFDNSNNFYEGSTVKSAPVELRDGVRLDYAVNVGDPATEKNDAIRSVLRELATIIVLKDLDATGQLENGEADEQALYKTTGAALISGVSKLTGLRADLGVAESAIERTQAHNAAERDALEQARAKIMARDPYEAATEIARLETQLQSIYAMTARSASLSLVNFLR